MPIFDNSLVELGAIAPDSTNPKLQEIENFRQASPIEIYRRFGDEGVAEQQRINTTYTNIRSPRDTRSPAVQTADIALGTIKAAINFGGNVASVGEYAVDKAVDILGGESPGNAYPVSDAIRKVSEVVGGLQSTQFQNFENLGEADFASRQAKRDPDLNFLGRVVGQAVDYSATIDKYPILAEQILAEAVGSVGAIGATTKGAIKGVSTALGGSVGKVGQAGIAAGIEGVSEGGGLSKEVYEKIINTDFNSLTNNSPRFNELVQAGNTPENARLILAERAADEAFVTGSAVSSVAGLISPFTESKLISKNAGGDSITNILQNAALEGVEETLQESGQTFVGNVAEQRYLDENTDLAKDVGRAAVEGAIGGVGATTILGVPRVTEEVAVRGADAIAEGGAVIAQSVAEDVVEAKETVTDALETIGEKRTDKKTDIPNEVVETVVENAETEAEVAPVADVNNNVEIIQKANELYSGRGNKDIRAAVRAPSRETVDKLRANSRKELTEASQGIKEIADRAKLYLAENSAGKSKKVVDLVGKATKFINNDQAKAFLALERLLSDEVGSSDTELGRILNNTIKAFSNIRGTAAAKKVNEDILFDGFKYFDEQIKQEVLLPSLVDLFEALELGIKTSKGKNTVLQGEVTPVADVVDQFSILVDNFTRKADAIVKSVEVGYQPIRYAKGKPDIGVSNSEGSKQFANTVLTEANAINNLFNAYKKSVDPKAEIDTVKYTLPTKPDPVKVQAYAEEQAKARSKENETRSQRAEPETPEKTGAIQEKAVQETQQDRPKRDESPDTRTAKEVLADVVDDTTTTPTPAEEETDDSRSDSGGESSVSPQEFDQNTIYKDEKRIVEEFTQNKKGSEEALAEVFANYTPDYFGTIYRGTGDHDFLDGKKVGEVLTIDRTTSFTKDKKIGESYTFYPSEEKVQPVKRQATFITIKKPGGYDISEISTIGAEQEVIIAPGTKFNIDKIETVGKVLHVDLSGIAETADTITEDTVGQNSNVVLNNDKPEKDGIEEVFGKAVSTAIKGGRDAILTSFKTSLKEKLPTLEGASESILQSIYKFTRDPITVEEVASVLDIGENINKDAVKEIKDNLLGGKNTKGLVKVIGNKLNAALKSNTKETNGKPYSPLKRFFNNPDKTLRYGGFGSFYFVEQFTNAQGNKDYRYLPSILEAVSIGTYDWIVNSAHRPVTKPEQIARILGIDPNDVTLEHIEAIKYGIPRKAAIKGLIRHLRGFLNIKDIDTQDIRLIDKAIGDLAAEVYDNLISLKIIDEKYFEGIDLYTVKVQKEATVKVVADIGQDNVRTFSKLFNSNYEETEYSVGEKIADGFIPKYQQGTGEELTKDERASIKIANDKPYYFNIDFFRLISRIPLNELRTLLGYEIISDKSNETHRINAEGKNTTINTHIQYLKDLSKAVRQHRDNASKNGIDLNVEDIPVYFAHRIIKSGRITQASPGPINTKLIRELVNGKPTTLDLTKEADQKAFWLSIASGLEIKIKKVGFENLKDNLQSKAEGVINDKFSETVKVIEDWISTESTDKTELSKVVAQSLVKELGNQASFREVHTLFSYANYLKAVKDGTTNALKHSLATEVDGVTNGAVNTLLFWLGSVGKDIKSLDLQGAIQNLKELLTAGGIFVSELGNDFASLNDYAGKDFYELIAEAVSDFANKSDSKQVVALNRFLHNLDVIDYDQETGEYEYGRSFAKGPLTQITYGAGANSIREGIQSDIVKEVYAAADKTARGFDNIWYEGIQDDVNTIFGKNVNGSVRVHADLLFRAPTVDKVKALKYAREFRFPEVSLTSLEVSLGALDTGLEITKGDISGVGSLVFGEALKLLGSVKNSTNTVLAAYTLQVDAAADYLDEQLVSVKEEQGFLSKADVQRIVDDAVDKFGLAVKTPYGIFNPAKKLVSETQSKIANQRESLQVRTDIVGLKREVGVSILPLLVIGLGDAFVVKDYLQKSGKGIAQYYDAFDLPTDSNIFAEGSKINESMFKALTTVNLPAYVLEGFEKAHKTGLLKTTDKANPDHLLKSIRNLSGSTSVFQAAFKSLKVRIHHYNTGFEDGSFVNEGSGKKVFLKNSTRGGQGVRVSGTDLVGVFRNKLKDSRRDRKTDATKVALYESVYNILSSNPELNFEVVYGDSKALGGVFRGTKATSAINVTNNTVYVLHEGDLTDAGNLDDKVLHEIIHGLTTSIFYRHFSGEKLNRVTTEAVSRLIKLAQRFNGLEIDTAQLSADQVDHINNLKKIMKFFDHADTTDYRKAAILSEFTAQFLTNKDLVAVGKRITIPEQVKKLARRVFEAISSIWGVKSKYDNLFEAIKFEFETIVLSAEESSETSSETLTRAATNGPSFINEQKILYNTGEQIDFPAPVEGLAQRIETKLSNIITQYKQRVYDPAQGAEENVQLGENLAKERLINFGGRSQSALNDLEAAGFTFSKEENQLFRLVHILYNFSLEDTSIELDKLSTVFSHVTKSVDSTKLGKNKFEALFKNQGKDILPSFVALSQSSREFRDVITEVELSAEIPLEDKSVDGYVNYTANKILNNAINLLHGNPNKDAGNNKEVLDNLVESITNIQEETTLDILLTGGKSLVEDTENVFAPAVQGITEAFQSLVEGSDLDIKHLEKTSITGESHVLRNLVREVIGTTDDIRGVHELVQKVRGEVTRQRQLFIEEIPKELNELYSEPVDTDTAKNLYEVILRGDVFAIANNLKDVLSVLDTDANLNARKAVLEGKLNKIKFGSLYINKAKQLAELINNGEVGLNLLKNADAIANLLGEQVGRIDVKKNLTANPDLVSTIDELASLYIVEGKPEALAEFRDLAAKDFDALSTTFSYTERLNREESKKIVNPKDSLVTFNKLKGSAIQERNGDHHIVIARRSKGAELEFRGYELIRGYLDPVSNKEYGYYYSESAVNNTYLQGALQITNNAIIHNINSDTGYEIGNHSIFDTVIPSKYGKAIRRSIVKGKALPEDYVAIYSADGAVTGYQRYVNPNKLNEEGRVKFDKIDTQSDLFKILGKWKGRLIEEIVGEKFNEVLIDRIIDQYQDAIKNKDPEFVSKAYVNVANTADPVWSAAWKKVPNSTKTYIAKKLGNAGTFYIRKDLVDNALGYPLPSLTDPFTGQSRLSEDTQKFLRAGALALFGNNAYKYLENIETVTLNVVKNTKETVIIRSLVVPFLNVASDQIHLLSRGVKARDIYEGTKKSIIELDSFHKKELEKTRLLIKIQSAEDDEKIKLKARIDGIEESIKRLSVYPLVEAGHLSTITEGLSETDRLIVKGRVGEYFEGVLNNLPDEVRAVGRQALIARDTALFKGISRVVQYSTVSSKMVYYSHLIKNGNTQEQALNIIADEFVNYDLLPGRARSFGDAFGLTWFFNYKLRIIKIALSLIVNHPVKAFLYSILFPTLGLIDVGGPIIDNAINVAAQDRLPYALGPERILRGQELHPFYQLMNIF